jgi:hypothetical protein
MPVLLVTVSIPFALIGYILILYFRLGWPGVLIVVVMISFIPLQILIGKINAKIL